MCSFWNHHWSDEGSDLEDNLPPRWFSHKWGGKAKRGNPKKKRYGGARPVATAAQRLDALRDVLPMFGFSGGALNPAADDDNDDDGEIPYGFLRGEIVGLRYYNGVVNNNEMVSLSRQPDNQYDSNAVKVSNVLGHQVGHIRKELARPLAFIMDAQLARVEGVIPRGADNKFSMPVNITFWGQAEHKETVSTKLRQYGYVLVDGVLEPGENRWGSSSSAEPNRTYISPFDIKSELDKLFEKLDEGDKTSEAQACTAICTPLFTHQKQALCWMMAVENNKNLPPFWEERHGPVYFNSITVSTSKTRPMSICGGILADDMGLGKTLEIIALILTNFNDNQPLATPVSGFVRDSKSAKLKRLEGYRQTLSKDSVISCFGSAPPTSNNNSKDCKRKSSSVVLKRFNLQAASTDPAASSAKNKELVVMQKKRKIMEKCSKVLNAQVDEHLHTLPLDGALWVQAQEFVPGQKWTSTAASYSSAAWSDVTTGAIVGNRAVSSKLNNALQKASNIIGTNNDKGSLSSAGVAKTSPSSTVTLCTNSNLSCAKDAAVMCDSNAVSHDISEAPKNGESSGAQSKDQNECKNARSAVETKLDMKNGIINESADVKNEMKSESSELNCGIKNKRHEVKIEMKCEFKDLKDCKHEVRCELGGVESDFKNESDTVQKDIKSTGVQIEYREVNGVSQDVNNDGNRENVAEDPNFNAGRCSNKCTLKKSTPSIPTVSPRLSGRPKRVIRKPVFFDEGSTERNDVIGSVEVPIKKAKTRGRKAANAAATSFVASGSGTALPAVTSVKVASTITIATTAVVTSVPTTAATVVAAAEDTAVVPSAIFTRADNSQCLLMPGSQGTNLSQISFFGVTEEVVTMEYSRSTMLANVEVLNALSQTSCTKPIIELGKKKEYMDENGDVEIVSQMVPDVINVETIPDRPDEYIDLDALPDLDTVMYLPSKKTRVAKKVDAKGKIKPDTNSGICLPSVKGTCSTQLASKSSGSVLRVPSGCSLDLQCSPAMSAALLSTSSQRSTCVDELNEFDLPDLSVLDLPGPSKTKFGKSTGRIKGKGPRATLIVCPLSTLGNWIDQIEEHVDERVMIQVHTYYGQTRTLDSKMLAEQDIVLTTYQTLAADEKGYKTLQKVHWLRIVLDEGHTIRNPAAQMTKAVLAMKTQRKWVVTGTPIQNSIKDLWSLVNFLGIEPFQDKQWWRRIIERPLSAGDTRAITRIKGLLNSIALRRTKTQTRDGKPILSLPEKSIYVEHIKLSEDERQSYDIMQHEGRIIVNKYFLEGTLLHHYGDVLAIMMRLRQMCCHPFLVAKAVKTAVQEISETPNAEKLTEDEFQMALIDKILMVLSSGSEEECAICLDELKSPVITHCAHLFCRPCIEAVITTETTSNVTAKCPMCRGDISMDKLVEVPPEQQKDAATVVAGSTDAAWQSSSKVDALMSALVRLRAEDPSIKSLVVSQFTSFLTLIEAPLKQSGFHFTRLDGTMSNKQRSAAIEAFSDKDPASPTIILLSLKAGGVGLNLTAGSRVFLMEPAWNPATEDQCFDRCHRIGQTREVVVTKFLVENSVEERMIELQERKKKLVQGIFGGGTAKKQTPDEIRQARINDIKTLINL